MVKMSMVNRIKRKAKKLACIALVAGMVVASVPAGSLVGLCENVWAAEYVVGNSIYSYAERPDGTIKITGYKGSDTELVIPSTIDGKAVTAIGQEAFLDNTDMVSLVIPEGVTTIEHSAFYKCSSLKSVVLADSVTTIDFAVFYGCSSLEDVTLSSNLNVISQYVFSGCSSLKAIEIPESVTTILYSAFAESGLESITISANVSELYNDAFENCTSLTGINVSENNNYYKSVDGVLFSKDGTTLYLVPIAKSDSSYIVPDSVTKIEDRAFLGCSNLTSITLPNGLGIIVGMYAFKDCTALKEIVIPEGVCSVNEAAFWNCSSLESVTIPALLTDLGDNIFRDCTSLSAINVSEENYRYKSIDGVLFNKDGTELLEYPRGRKGSYTVPETTKKIVSQAFSMCNNLTEVVIPDTVERIENFAFVGCSLPSVTLECEDMKVSTRAFGWNKYSNLATDINYDFVYKGNKGGIAEQLAKSNFSKFESTDGTYTVDYANVEGCYDTCVANYEAVTEYLNEFYIEKYPDMALENTWGRDSDRAFFKELASKIIAEDSEVSVPVALWNWMNKNIGFSENMWERVGYPMDVYNLRIADCTGNAELLCELLRSAGIPAVTCDCYFAGNSKKATEKYIAEYQAKAYGDDTLAHRNVLAYWDNQWIIVDSSLDMVLTTKEAICEEFYITGIDGDLIIYNELFNFNLEPNGRVYKDGEFITVDNGDIFCENISFQGSYSPEEDLRYRWDTITEGGTYVSDGTDVVHKLGQEGLFKYNYDVYYQKKNSGLAVRCFKELDDKLIWFNQVGTPFDITEIKDTIRTYKGCPLVDKGTTFAMKTLIEDIEDIELSWTSSNTDVATVDSEGNVTAVGNGVVQIEAYYELWWGNWLYMFEMYVDTLPTELSVTEKLEMKSGQNSVLEIVTNNTPQTLTNFIWESSDETVVTVDRTGNVTAVAPGVAEITVTYGDGSGLSATSTVIVSSDDVSIKGDETGEGVYIECPKDTVDDKVTLYVKPIGKDHKDYEDIKPLEDVEFIAYDINLKDENDVKVQPNGKIKVRIPCPEGFEVGKCRVYYVNADGKYVNMKAEYSGGFLIFETNHFSTYMVTADKLSDEVEYIYGDANSDGNINVADGVVLKKHLAGITVDINLDACDVNADGKTDVSDAVMLMKHLAGYEISLGMSQ